MLLLPTNRIGQFSWISSQWSSQNYVGDIDVPSFACIRPTFESSGLQWWNGHKSTHAKYGVGQKDCKQKWFLLTRMFSIDSYSERFYIYRISRVASSNASFQPVGSYQIHRSPGPPRSLIDSPRHPVTVCQVSQSALAAISSGKPRAASPGSSITTQNKDRAFCTKPLLLRHLPIIWSNYRGIKTLPKYMESIAAIGHPNLTVDAQITYRKISSWSLVYAVAFVQRFILWIIFPHMIDHNHYAYWPYNYRRLYMYMSWLTV